MRRTRFALIAIALATAAATTAAAPGANVPPCTGCPPGIVAIQTNVHFQRSTWWGTGIVLTSSGAILTNNHVIRGASSITVTDHDNGHTYKADVAGYDIVDDVAVLQVRGASELQTARLGNSGRIKVGEPVIAYGLPNGPGTTPVAAPGTLSNRHAAVSEWDPYTGATLPLHGLISSDAPTRPGFSGGPLLDKNGNVVAINTVGGSDGAGGHVSGAIPINRARSIARAVETGHSTGEIHVGPTSFLGFTVQPGELYQGLTSGVTVITVIARSPAARADLEPGDVVQYLNGHPVRTASDFVSRISDLRPGTTAEISWTTTAGIARTEHVLLAAGPPQ
jgi:S1-C subfamily serine protease